VLLTDAADPVAAFWRAHATSGRVALPTSGTSGPPRVIERTTASWVDSFPLVAGRLRLTADSRLHVPGPLASTMNLFAACLAQSVGATWGRAVEGATHHAVTPAGLARLRGAGGTALVAGDGLSAALRDEARAAGLSVEHYYGATELSLVAWGTCRDDLVPFDRVDVQIRDGRLWARSPWLSDGPAAGSPVGSWARDEDGFATVGDRAEEVGGRIVVAGRDGAVTTGGATVTLAPVEAVLRGQARGEVHLVGVPHATLGQVLGCVVTDVADMALLRLWAREQLTPAERPRRWAIVAELPLTPAGKVDEAALVALLHRRYTGVSRRDPDATRREEVRA